MPQQIITLGRSTDNTVVLSESNVSTHHARLIVDGDQIFVEDLGSTNGTSVKTIENKISRAAVGQDDTIFLGSTKYQVSELIGRSVQPIAIKPVDAGTNAKASRESQETSTSKWAILCVTGLLTLSIGWFAMRNRDTGEGRQPQTSATEHPSPDPATIETATDDLASRSPASIPREPEASEEIDISQPERLLQSLFVIVCADPQRETPFRVGTGFAIDAEHVATSAAVIQALEGLKQNGFTEAFLFSPATDRELRIESATYHPQFEVANRLALAAQQEHDAIFDELESNPPKPEAFEAVKDQLVAARLTALQAMDQKTTCDVAILKVNQPLSHWLPAADSGVVLRPNQKLNVTGYAFDVEDPYFDRTVPIDLATTSIRVGQLIKSTDDSAAKLVAKGDLRQDEFAYLGSPILNTQGKVVGIYSRPTPPSREGDLEVELTFDVALVQRLRECIADRN